MTFTLAALMERLQQPLPGEAAHQIMYPRAGISPDLLKAPETVRLSAVAILLFERDNDWHSVVIQRQVYDGTHSGQIGFPGGKWETDDASMLETALRECSEEIGVGADELEHVGKLSDVYTAVSSFMIEPYVFHWKTPRTTFITSEREVAAVYTISLHALLNEEIERIDIPLQSGIVLKNVPHFVFGDTRIWGATALILSELKEVLKSL
jgi:8-oxo-dGTP pyrophosphatase MutT (NUDIX family)